MLSEISQDNYRRVKEILVDALDLAPADRTDYLRAACGGSDYLRAEVESLLAADEHAPRLENFSVARLIQDSFEKPNRLVGRMIGKYRLLGEIGRGGMGVVFLAEREDYRQQAAIKLIKRGMDSDAILERFTREREILAALNHPFIARLTDGGTTAEGLPFFVMEYVEGVPLDEYCEKNSLAEREILKLFGKICEAVSFAHQKLVVHRDLKPSNILVTADATPKLLDFGIAKLLNSNNSNETQTNQRALTPAYASPEQMRGEVVDTTSDVYSLGKILAELLDFSIDTSGSQTTGETERRSTNSRKSPLPTDLKAILQTALREEPSRRYSSVEKFADDIRRQLRGLPVSARRDTFSYRAVKFIQRKRYAAAFTLLLILTLFGGIAATLWQAHEAERERAVAERRFDTLRKISGSFVTEIHGAIQNLPGSLPARKLLLRHAVEQLDALAAEAGDNPALQDELAQAYFNSAELPDMLLAEKISTLKKEIAIYQKLTAEDAANIHYREQTAMAEIELGDVIKVSGSVAEGIESESQGVELLEQIIKDEPGNTPHLLNLATAYLNIAGLYVLKGDAGKALEVTRRELRTIEELRKNDPAEPQIQRLSDIGHLQLGGELMLTGDYQAAILTLRQSLADYSATHEKSPNDTRPNYYLWSANRRLADALEKSGDAVNAAEHLHTALTIIESLAAASPNDLGYDRNSAVTNILYGRMLTAQKRPAQAIPYFRRALELSRKVLENDADNSESRFDTAEADANLGNALILTGKNEGADYLFEAEKMLADICRRDSQNDHAARTYAETREWCAAVSKKSGLPETRKD